MIGGAVLVLALWVTAGIVATSLPAASVREMTQVRIAALPAEPLSPKVGSVTDATVVLSWLDLSFNETGFKTQYSTNGGKSWTAGPTAPVNAKSTTIGGLAASTKYTFQVGATNNGGTKWSAYATATTGPVRLPAEPASPTAGSVTATSVVLSWRDASYNETGFKTQYSTNGGKTWTPGPSASANAKSSPKISGLAPSTKYTFQVGATNRAGTKWSAYVTFKTPVGAAGACNAKWGSGVAKPTEVTSATIAGWRLPVCGPAAPKQDDGKHNTEPFPGYRERYPDYILGYQCTELAARWLYYRLGDYPECPTGSCSPLRTPKNMAAGSPW